MDTELYLLFVGSCIMLGLIPGPNIALIVANSIAHGTRYGLVSVAGTSSAMAPQLAITVLGATTLLAFMASAFEWLRWIGVAYLIYLGLKHWFSAAKKNAGRERRQKEEGLWKGLLAGIFGLSNEPENPSLFWRFSSPVRIRPGKCDSANDASFRDLYRHCHCR